MPEDPQEVATRDLEAAAAVRELAAIASGKRSDPDRPPTDPPPGTCDWGDCAAYAADWRWSDDGGGWLPVCADHVGEPAAAAEGDEGAFVPVRDFVAQLSRSAAMVPLDVVQQAIDEGERALTLGPVLDPTLFQRGADELEQQLRLLRTFVRFRLALEAYRPGASA